MVSSNLNLWSQLSVTDPRFTKGFRKAGGFSGTDINPTWRMKRLTEAFGPAGVGWWYKIAKTWSEDIGGKKFAFVLLELYYMAEFEGADGELQRDVSEPIQQIGGTEFGRSPDEAYKMAVTDALGKCAAALGLAADVYMGQFDDSKYQRQAADFHAGNELLGTVGHRLDKCQSLAEVDELGKWVGTQKPPTSIRPALKALFDNKRESFAVTAGNGNGNGQSQERKD